MSSGVQKKCGIYLWDYALTVNVEGKKLRAESHLSVDGNALYGLINRIYQLIHDPKT